MAESLQSPYTLNFGTISAGEVTISSFSVYLSVYVYVDLSHELRLSRDRSRCATPTRFPSQSPKRSFRPSSPSLPLRYLSVSFSLSFSFSLCLFVLLWIANRAKGLVIPAFQEQVVKAHLHALSTTERKVFSLFFLLLLLLYTILHRYP